MESEDTGPAAPRAGAVVAAAGIAAASTSWAAYLWQQLLVSRGGGSHACLLGGGGCAAVWDGPFATRVQELSGLPVAAWGVVWGAVALALCVWTWRRVSAGRPAEPAWSAVGAVATGGVLSVLVLASVAYTGPDFCSDCAITHVLVLAYAAVVLSEFRRARPSRAAAGAVIAGLGTLAAMLAVLPAGLRTPPAETPSLARVVPELRADPRTERSLDARLGALLSDLDEAQRQSLSDTLGAWRAAPERPGEPRALRGSRFAPVRLTVFTDSGCIHCARFHEGLEDMLGHLPPDALAVESRVFPLDGACNPGVSASGRAGLCVAARARICIEADPRAHEFERSLFGLAPRFESEEIYALGAGYLAEDSLRACAASPKTQRALEQDLADALATDIHGTPHVLVNGRRARADLGFVYVMALAAGDPDHPKLRELPPPRPLPKHEH